MSKSEPHYLCQRCGNCCRWPGDVRLTEADVGRIARFLGMTVYEFTRDHTRLNASRTALSLLEQPDHACEFLVGDDVCSINPVKPMQCRGFPNEWRFPGWREVCEAVPVAAGTGGSGSAEKIACNTVPGS